MHFDKKVSVDRQTAGGLGGSESTNKLYALLRFSHSFPLQTIKLTDATTCRLARKNTMKTEKCTRKPAANANSTKIFISLFDLCAFPAVYRLAISKTLAHNNEHCNFLR